MKIGCVILNYNDYENTIKCMEHLKDYDSIDKILLVDNNSSDDSYSELTKYSDSKVIVLQTEKNGGYGYGNNFGVKYAYYDLKCEYVIIMNPDVVIEEETIKKMILELQSNKEVAIVAPLQVDCNNQASIVGWSIPSINQYLISPLYLLSKIFNNYQIRVNQNMKEMEIVDCALGALLMIDAEKFIECGGYDEDIFLFCEEVVLGIRLKKCNYKTIILTKEKYWHFHSVSINKNIPQSIKKRKILFTSREVVLKKYLKSDSVTLKLYSLFCKIGLFEEYIISKIKSGKK